MEMGEEDLLFSGSEHLTRKEVLKRRILLLKKLKRIYHDRYWLLMEDMKNQVRDYYWDHGTSPFVDEEENNNNIINNNNNYHNDAVDNAVGVYENGNPNNGSESGVCTRRVCGISGCDSKAMALTRYCHMHIMSDSNQKLYKACIFTIKSSTSGPILCEKPILRSISPSFCTLHFQKFEKNVTKALKKSGMSVSSANKVVPIFHVVIKECVREILKNRRAALRAQMDKADEKDDISI